MLALIVIDLVVTFLAAFASYHLARAKERRPTGWVLAAVLFPPSVLVLALMPNRAASPRGAFA